MFAYLLVTIFLLVPAALAQQDEIQNVKLLLNIFGPYQPVEGAIVQLWQADQYGRYYDSTDPSFNKVPGFNYFGTSEPADAEGRVKLWTTMPGSHQGSPPQLHIKVWVDLQEVLTTTLFFVGEESGAVVPGSLLLNRFRKVDKMNQLYYESPKNIYVNAGVGFVETSVEDRLTPALEAPYYPAQPFFMAEANLITDVPPV